MSDYKLYGYTMSPYSMKLRSYFRYRRIPFQWVTGSRANDVAMTKVDTYMVPVVENPEGKFKNDSTFLIDDLEARFTERAAVPDNEADAFLAFLIEDFADEWLLLPFFMHRWRHEKDRLFHSKWIVYEHMQGQTTDQSFDDLAAGWSSRQMKSVSAFCGSEDMYPILERSLDELLDATERAFTTGLFLFGSRPSRAEFALYGVLSQLVIDNAPSLYLREKYNFTYRWVTIVEDLSGVEGVWKPISSDQEKMRTSPIADILKLSAKYHLPLLRSNTEAIEAGRSSLSFEVDGETFVRRTTERYLHCLPAIQERYRALSREARGAIDEVLRKTGCLEYLDDA